ncbi:MAG: RNA polymerase sigma-70 factor [Chitinophagaceae bacterium]|nr:RNA polymerase sigma-70 factor [Chitinophagaceae bacterium]
MQNRFAYLQDEESYRKIFFHYYPLLLNFCSHILHDKEDAEEVVSDVLLKVWTMGNQINYIENLTLYLYKSAQNRAYDVLRKRSRNISTEEINEENVSGYSPVFPEEQYAAVELDKSIQQAIEKLPVQCKLVFRLIREHGFTYKQTAEILDISLNTVETHMRIAFKKLREVLRVYLS